ncbi:MAG: hypothetical protein DMF64_19655 [Acidobacteria bacterium]|nr:MAG: hypothetical protein DMF64_19655 [Acidobacteriota bacterium]
MVKSKSKVQPLMIVMAIYSNPDTAIRFYFDPIRNRCRPPSSECWPDGKTALTFGKWAIVGCRKVKVWICASIILCQIRICFAEEVCDKLRHCVAGNDGEQLFLLL